MHTPTFYRTLPTAVNYFPSGNPRSFLIRVVFIEGKNSEKLFVESISRSTTRKRTATTGTTGIKYRYICYSTGMKTAHALPILLKPKRVYHIQLYILRCWSILKCIFTLGSRKGYTHFRPEKKNLTNTRTNKTLDLRYYLFANNFYLRAKSSYVRSFQ